MNGAGAAAMRVKANPAAAASGAEMLARYRAARARLMGAAVPATPAKPSAPVTPAASAVAADPAPPASLPPVSPPDVPAPTDWRAELIAFNEELRRLFIGATARRKLLLATRIRDVVAAHFGITVAEIVGSRSSRQCARPRQIAMFICARHTGLSSPRIGALFGGRDYSTVLYAVRKIAARKAADPALAAEIDALVARCRAGARA